uniref:Uncharacterized protein n=1 Tax=Rhodopseudomonas palustris (strain BisA53) TaxID=316055 RepID=Q07KK3_RHOP5
MILLIFLRTRRFEMSDATYNLNGGFKPTTKRFADLSGPDFFPTPRWATFALIENEKFDGDCSTNLVFCDARHQILHFWKPTIWGSNRRI